MKKIFIMFGLALAPKFANAKDSFLVKFNNKIIVEEGDCKTRYSPCSTFKIAISLMAYEENLLINEENPVIPYDENCNADFDKWKQPHTPKMWMPHSCVWFSQVLTKKMGDAKFFKYVKKLNYGNKDIKGDPNKNNGLTNCWLSSSLKISAFEQIEFLENLINNRLPFFLHAQEMTKSIIFIGVLEDGWKLYGKTGSGYQLDDKKERTQIHEGWFIGFLEKNGKYLVFAYHILDDEKQNDYAGQRAKSLAVEKLKMIVKSIKVKA